MLKICLPLSAAPLLVLFAFMIPRRSAADDFRPVGTITDKRVNESSGIAASRNHPGHLWIHNDSGDEPRLFLIDPSGHVKAVVQLLDAAATDWEDMCSFELDGRNYLLIGDIGDNNRQRDGRRKPLSRLYLIEEPKVPRSNGQPTLTHKVRAVIDFEYDDGPTDCEGLAFDPQRREVLLLTKAAPQRSGLYSLPLDLQLARQRGTARRIASPFLPFVTAMDVTAADASGTQQLIVGSMFSGLLVTRASSQTWEQAFRDQARSVDLPGRRQGETVCFDPTHRWLYLNSEGVGQPLWKIPVPAAKD